MYGCVGRYLCVRLDVVGVVLVTCGLFRDRREFRVYYTYTPSAVLRGLPLLTGGPRNAASCTDAAAPIFVCLVSNWCLFGRSFKSSCSLSRLHILNCRALSAQRNCTVRRPLCPLLTHASRHRRHRLDSGHRAPGDRQGGFTASGTAIVHFGSLGHLCGLFERSKAT